MESLAATQVLVLGGGLTPNGLLGKESAERAISAAYWCQEHEVDRAVFSGGCSWLTLDRARGTSEAEMMADIAAMHGMNAEVLLDIKARNTLEGILNSESLLNDTLTGIVTHAYHLPRALLIARKVLTIHVFGIEALSKHSERSFKNELLLRQTTRMLLAGITAGDVNKIAARNQQLLKVTSKLAPILGKTLFRNHTSLQS